MKPKSILNGDNDNIIEDENSNYSTSLNKNIHKNKRNSEA
jgi:hypothetical protein